MEHVGVSKFRENLLAFLKRVERGESITITSRGKSIAVVTPVSHHMKSAREALKELREGAAVGDIVNRKEVDGESAR
ncbi:MAG: type II toxin-antitoxin system Phd/YefM family antitoxin [Thermodesulfobacteriota bacterium]